ncbi:hypothetical protein [Candidatus Poriferisodalis sp.]|uniref:hypothetical protein n=1 Tax=Candidatus Poriferisodalis sp. TaxID=3101277 RepID=UPI003B01F378
MSGDADAEVSQGPVGSGGADARFGSAGRGVGLRQRSLLVPVLSTVVGALVAGVFVFAALGFATLRNDIKSLDTKIDTKINALDTKIDALDTKIDTEINALGAQMDALDTKIDTKINALDTKIDTKINALDTKFDTKINALGAQMDARFAEVGLVLLDHTDRLARIEAIYANHTHP